MKILYGIQPTGRLHIGHYLGGLKLAIHMQKENEVIFMIADLHALTTQTKQETTEKMLSLEDELHKAGAQYVKYQYPEALEKAWEIMCLTPVSELERMTQWKDKGQGNAGLLTYPCLMAADIILSGCDAVIVGEDQTQHIEFYRKSCKRLGIEPITVIETGTRIMSLSDPTKKMSKSDEKGCLFLFDENYEQKIMKAVTTPEGEENLKKIRAGLHEGNLGLKKGIIESFKETFKK